MAEAGALQQEETPQGIDRVAVLLMALGETFAAEVLKHLDPRELHKIGAAMTGLSNVNRGQVCQILKDFNGQVQDQTSIGVDSQDYVRNVLIRAVGRDKAKGVMDHILQAHNDSGVDALKWMDGRAIAGGLREEHPQVVALVLASLETTQAAEVLNLLPDALRDEAIFRVANLDQIPSGALTELNELIEKQVMTKISAASTAAVGGPERAAEILNLVDGSVEGQIMDKIKAVDSELADQIEDLMMIFESLIYMSDRDIQTLLREVASENLVVALRGADDAVKQKILGNLSRRAAEILQDDLENTPPVRLSDVEAAQKKILSTAKRLSEAGEISLGGKGGNEFV
jgi:flagellar motor switch protein FliG